MKHIPALDGIRGIAILLVLFFHLRIAGFSLGWAGVPLFFVLSGFLITGILVEHRQEKLSDYIRLFYAKRALRIFPLFYAYLAVNFAILAVTGRSVEGYGWYLAYLQNYHIGLELDGSGKIPGIVGHTWSLAVEEQFYLLWPFLVYFLSRLQLAWTCAALILAAPVVRWAIVHNTGNVYLANITLPSCLDMMAYGALLALLRSSQAGTKIVCTLFAVGSLLAGKAVLDLGLAAFWQPREWVPSAPYLFTALAFVFGPLIWFAAVKPIPVLIRAVSVRPLLFTGKISYGLYIWHMIVFLAVEKMAAKLNLPAAEVVTPLVALLAAYAVSTLSFYGFENRFLRLKDGLASRQVLKPAVP